MQKCSAAKSLSFLTLVITIFSLHCDHIVVAPNDIISDPDCYSFHNLSDFYPNYNEIDIIGNVKTVDLTSYLPYKRVVDSAWDTSEKMQYKITFDNSKRTQKLMMIESNTNKFIGYHNFTYGTCGELLNVESFTSNDSNISSSMFIRSGNMITIINSVTTFTYYIGSSHLIDSMTSGGKPRITNSYEYDSNRRLISDTYIKDDTIQTIERYEYTNNGKLYRSSNYNSKGNLFGRAIHYYHSDGQFWKKENFHYDSLGQPIVGVFQNDITEYSNYKLDNKGNWIERIAVNMRNENVINTRTEKRNIAYYE